MDPNELLKQLQAALAGMKHWVEDTDCNWYDEIVPGEEIGKLYTSAKLLDTWLKKGGCLPDDWKKESPIHNDVP